MSKKILFLIITLLPKIAYPEPYTEPDQFIAENNKESTYLTWIIAEDDNIKEKCDQYAISVGNQPFTIKMYSCVFYWEQNNSHYCTIITPKHTKMSDVGHEIRHCFQGAFHDY